MNIYYQVFRRPAVRYMLAKNAVYKYHFIDIASTAVIVVNDINATIGANVHLDESVAPYAVIALGAQSHRVLDKRARPSRAATPRPPIAFGTRV